MKINYKITTIVLALVLVVTYAWHWEAILAHTSSDNTDNKMSGMHQMPDGSMMMSDGSTMNMGSMTMDEMVGMMKGKTGKELEKEFLAGMIPHHQGAVEMAKLLLQDKTVSAQVAKFAQDIINAQESEIQMMSEWLKNY